jgi:hypothetical protein
MAIVSYSCSAPSLACLPLKVLAKLQDTEVTFVDEAASPTLKTVTHHPVIGTSSTTESVSWVGCTRTLSQLIPSLGLWDGPLVESWVDAAAVTLLPLLESGEYMMEGSKILELFETRFLLLVTQRVLCVLFLSFIIPSRGCGQNAVGGVPDEARRSVFVEHVFDRQI